MIYLSFLFMVSMLVGLIAVASNPSPYYAAIGLVLSAMSGCFVLVDLNISFLSLVLLLIYLGGMLVVFAYSASLAAEPFPEAWGSWSVLTYVFLYIFGLICYLVFNGVSLLDNMFSVKEVGFNNFVNDFMGVGVMYSSGALFLIMSGWALLLTLFVVLEITWGVSCGSLRAV
uniref:NADH-ubiquinone oxidoreductase chain 6 n=1 Tax=Hemidactylium scutatum TaxID=291265 RepID=Q644F4_9SALA|nr:NADH dehydrogenase subunit 6 [Hemidactylium scutatum]AAU20680.1 NADH dehydrogenase subunit 6 [Hemidactylium scutatum]